MPTWKNRSGAVEAAWPGWLALALAGGAGLGLAALGLDQLWLAPAALLPPGALAFWALRRVALVHRTVHGRMARADRRAAAAEQLLSSVDTDALIRGVLERLPELHPCDSVSIAVRWRGERRGEAHLRCPPQAAVEVVGVGSRALRELRRIFRAAPGALVLERGDPRLEALAHPARPGSEVLVAVPLQFERDLLGVICIGLGGTPAPAELEELCRFAGHASVALCNTRMIDEVRSLTYYDELTGLPNRILCTEQLGHAIGRARSSGGSLAVLLVDLDSFKRVNESLGQDAGDDLLRAAAERIAESLAPGSGAGEPADTARGPELFRVGGDEFVCILEDLDDTSDAAALAEQILAELSRPFERFAGDLSLGASIGISTFPGDGEDAEGLMRNAQAAMAHAKEEGRRDFRFYRGFMNEHASRRLSLENRLRKALDGGDLHLQYQPIVDAAAGRIVGVEVLSRWSDADLGAVSPSEFIGVAEESGLILALGEWTIRTALDHARQWQRAGLPAIGLSLNVSGRQFRDRHLAEMIRVLVAGSDIDPARLTLELTESVLMRRTEETLASLRKLREAGLRLSIDDFGTGFSSLGYLRDLPVDSLKVDRCFVSGLGSSARDEAIVSAVLALGRVLGLKVVAEGVERREQLDFLRAQGCSLVQGQLFSPAVSPDAIADHLRAGARAPDPRG